jgi:hypothetical protein
VAEYWTIRVRADKVKEVARSIARMFGVFFRDGGILVIVFGILDAYEKVSGLPPNWKTDCWWIGFGSFIVGVIFGLIGGDR